MKTKTKIALTLATIGVVTKVVLSTKHFLTVYEENSKLYAESWLQLDVFDRSYCFSKNKKEIAEISSSFVKLTFEKSTIEYVNLDDIQLIIPKNLKVISSREKKDDNN